MLSATYPVPSRGNIPATLQLFRTNEPNVGHCARVTIGELIRQARADKDLTQRELGRRIGVKHSAVSQWEAGVTRPTIENRADLARILDIPFVKLIPEIAPDDKSTMNDRQIFAVIQLLNGLPEPVVEAVLTVAAAMADQHKKILA